MERRIHITGASGSGVSTLARELATRLSTQAFDTDDFYWLPTDPPFQEKRPILDRLRLMDAVFMPRRDWIVAGSLHSWGAPVMDRVTHVIFLTLDSAQRVARLRARERQRLGDRIRPGGDLAHEFRGFLDWAASYDDPDGPGRSRVSHEAWLATLHQPVIRLTSDRAPAMLADAAIAALDAADRGD
ncbi:MAG: AAA family ATPase [Pseudomonadota bacterium]